MVGLHANRHSIVAAIVLTATCLTTAACRKAPPHVPDGKTPLFVAAQLTRRGIITSVHVDARLMLPGDLPCVSDPTVFIADQVAPLRRGEALRFGSRIPLFSPDTTILGTATWVSSADRSITIEFRDLFECDPGHHYALTLATCNRIPDAVLTLHPTAIQRMERWPLVDTPDRACDRADPKYPAYPNIEPIYDALIAPTPQ